MSKLKAALALLTIVTVFGVGGQAAMASSNGEKLVVVLSDRYAVAEADGGIDLSWSMVSLAAYLGGGQRFAFAGADDPGRIVGPLPSSDPEFRASRSSIDDRLASVAAKREPDMVLALASTFNFLRSRQAAPGSTVYLISGGDISGGGPDNRLGEASDQLIPTAALFAERGWTIVGLSLPGASPEVTEFLSSVSGASGGEVLHLSSPDGLIALSDRVFRESAKGSLTLVDETLLASDSVLTSTVSIPPGTSEASLIFFREDASGSFRLNNPRGTEPSAVDLSSSSVVETPHVVMWHLVDPAPGDWMVDIRGANGTVSAWSHAVNRLGVALLEMGAFPLDEPAQIIAYATDQGGYTVLEAVSIVARITSPSGGQLVYQLNDSGHFGDALANDGYFSTTISPLTEQGEHRVDLELSWRDVSYALASRETVRTERFPTIDVTWLETGPLEHGVRAKVGTLESHVAGQSFALAEHELRWTVTSRSGQPGKIDLVPVTPLRDGRAWLYDVFFTPEDDGQHLVKFQLRTNYAGRDHSASTELFAVSALAPIVEVEPATVVRTIPAPETVITTSEPRLIPTAEPIPAPEPATVPPPAAAPAPVAAPAPAASSDFPWVPIAVMAVLLIALIATLIYWLSRSKPYGYLYNDKDEPVADFGSLKRRPAMVLLFKNLVSGSELGLPGLEGVSFRFFRSRIGLAAKSDSPTVRVNNQPVIGESTLRDGSWIGAHGKLYSFLMSQPPPPAPEPGAADD